MSDQSNKRLRHNTDEPDLTMAAKATSAAKSHTSPTKAAEDALLNHSSSLPTSLHPLLHHYGRQIIDVRTKLSNKIKMKEKLDKETSYIPKSARATAFKITLSKDAIDLSEDGKMDFLETQALQAKEQYEKALRSIVEECIDLEINALRRKEDNLIADTLHSLANATLTMHGITDVDIHLRVANLIKYDWTIFQHCNWATSEDIAKSYNRHHSCTLPTPTLKRAIVPHSASDEAIQAIHAAAALSMGLKENTQITELRNAAAAVILHPHTAFTKAVKENTCLIALKKLSHEIVTGKATEDATMELEADGTANLTQLKDLIRQEVNKRDTKIKQLERKVDQLSTQKKNNNTDKANNRKTKSHNQQPVEKNTPPRGRKSASNKKKSLHTVRFSRNTKPPADDSSSADSSTSSRPRSILRNRNGKGRADDASNASPRDKPNLPGNKRRNKSPSKQNNSNGGNRQHSRA